MEIVPHVHLVPGLGGANAYLLSGETITLVDTGMPGSGKTILDYLNSLDRTPGDLGRIVVTHHHLEHVGGLADVKARTSAQVLAHPADAPFISGEQQPPPASSAMMRLLFLLLAPLMPGAKPVPVDETLQDSDHLDMLSGATVVHVPGHTLGSITLHFPAERLLICGDVINHRRNRLGPPPKGFTADMDQAIAFLVVTWANSSYFSRPMPAAIPATPPAANKPPTSLRFRNRPNTALSPRAAVPSAEPVFCTVRSACSGDSPASTSFHFRMVPPSIIGSGARLATKIKLCPAREASARSWLVDNEYLMGRVCGDRPGLQHATEEPSVPATRVSSFVLEPRALGRLDEVDESDSPMRRRSRNLLLSDYID